MAPTLAQLLPRKPCCCDGAVSDCADCPEKPVSLCYRVRRAYPFTPDAAWPEGADSLWFYVPNANAHCGEGYVTDQLGCRTDKLEAWSFTGEISPDLGSWSWAYPGWDFYETILVEDAETRVTPIGWPYKLTWNVEGSCSVVKISMIGGFGTPQFGSGVTATDYSHEVLEIAFIPSGWPETFRLGEWEFTRSTNCITPVAGPTCLRVLGGADDVDVVVSTFDPEAYPHRLGPISGQPYNVTQGSCHGVTDDTSDSFGGNLVDNEAPAKVWWRIDPDRMKIQVHVSASVFSTSPPPTVYDDESVEIDYTPDWWVGGIAVGPYTVMPCDTNCIAISCLPTCVVQDCDGLNRARPLKLTVTGCPDMAELAPATFPTVDGGGFQSGTFGYGPTSPPGEPPVAQVSIQYSCNGSGQLVREVFVMDTDAAEFTVGPTVVSNACSGGSWADSFSLTLQDCTPTFDVFSDGTDPWGYL